jgi:transcription-repair coupling factor (superfamily II helicase)
MHLLDFLRLHPALSQVAASSRAGSVVSLSSTPSSSWGTLAAFFQRECKSTTLLVLPTGETAERAANDLRALFDEDDENSPRVLFFPTPDRVGDEDDLSTTRERLGTLDALHGGKPVVVVTTAKSLATPTLPPDELRHGYDEIVVGQTLEREPFLEHLSSTGFERVDEVEASGQFAARGGIVDFFPPASPSAIRLELFGDEVDSLRFFNIETQRSTEKIPSIRLTPPREVYLSPRKGREVATQLQELLDEQSARLERNGRADAAEALRERAGRDIEKLRGAVYFPGLDRYRALLYPSQPSLLEHLPAAPQWCGLIRAARVLKSSA